MALKISEEAKVQMPMKTVASLDRPRRDRNVGFFRDPREAQPELNTNRDYGCPKDLVMNTEFRIKWPRGLLGSLPADSEQFMLIEELHRRNG